MKNVIKNNKPTTITSQKKKQKVLHNFSLFFFDPDDKKVDIMLINCIFDGMCCLFVEKKEKN